MKGKKLSYKESIEKLESDKNARRKTFKELCDHVRRGYSLECFGPISIVSIKRYLEVYPEEFIQEELEQAAREGQIYWEDIGNRQANGQCLGNSRTWIYNMMNRYKWSDRLQVEAEHKGQVSVNIVSYATRDEPTDTQE